MGRGIVARWPAEIVCAAARRLLLPATWRRSSPARRSPCAESFRVLCPPPSVTSFAPTARELFSHVRCGCHRLVPRRSSCLAVCICRSRSASLSLSLSLASLRSPSRRGPWRPVHKSLRVRLSYHYRAAPPASQVVPVRRRGPHRPCPLFPARAAATSSPAP